MAIYDEMAGAGLPIHITEFWAHTGHLKERGLAEDVIEQAQADYVLNHLTCAFSHPAVEGFFFWGMFGDAVKWNQRSSHSPRRVFGRLRDLLRNQWMTRLETRTDRDGRVRFRGFLGEYVLRCAISDKARSGVRFTVAREDAMPLVLRVAR